MTNPLERPGKLYLDGDITFESNHPSSIGGFGDLFVGTSHDGTKVAMKRLRVVGKIDDFQRYLDETIAEAKVWRNLVHEHVLFFLGILLQNKGIYLVSPFLKNGSLPAYILAHPDADRGTMLREVAEGLAYLHDQGVIHGDVKGENILVSDDPTPHAKLCDFGLSKFLDAAGTATKGGLGTLRWQSPELINGGHRSFESDVYAYGMTIAEIITGQIPFYKLPSDSQVMVAVLLRDERPIKGDATSCNPDLFDALWAVAELSWQKNSVSRPSMSRLKGVMLALRPSSNETLSAAATLFNDDPLPLQLSPRPMEKILGTDKTGPSLALPRRKSYGTVLISRDTDRPDQLVSDTHEPQKPQLANLNASEIDDETPRGIERLKRIEALPRAKSANIYAQRPDAHSTCLEGTRVAVLSKIQAWVRNSDPSAQKVFLVSGMAGTGKSTIAQTIALQFDNEEILGASFFFGARGEKELRSADLVIPTLAYQLSRFSVEFKRCLADALEKNPDTPHELWARQLQKLFVVPLREVKIFTPILIVLDAMDECVQPDAEEILNLMLSAVAQLNIPVKLLITSRPEPFVISAFSKHSVQNEIVLQDVDATVVTEDIRYYLRYSLNRAVSGPSAQQLRVSEQDIETLVQRSGKLFVYAATAVRFIQNNRAFPPALQLKMLLDMDHSKSSSALSYLDALYLNVLKTAENMLGGLITFELIRNIFGALVLLKAPLPLEALERLHGLESGLARAALYPFHSIIVTPQYDQEPALIYHQSFSEFITDPSRCTDTRFLVDPLHHEQRLASLCLNHMKRCLKRNIAQVPEAYLLDPDDKIPKHDELVAASTPKELDYSCVHWGDHMVRATPGDKDLLDALEDFTTTRALWWCESMSNLYQFSSAILNLQNAHSWATKSQANDHVIDLLNDLERFSIAHSELIGTAAQHVYYSALPFVPQGTRLWQTYRFEADRSVEVLCGTQAQWTQLLTTLWAYDCTLDATFSPEGSVIASASRDGYIWLWDAVSETYRVCLQGHTDSVKQARFSPDGSKLASCSDDKTIRIWNPVSGEQEFVLEGHTAPCNTLMYSKDGSRLVSGSDDTTVRIWDAGTGSARATCEGHGGPVYAVAFSPDGLQIASGGKDTTVRIWDAALGGQVSILQGHTGSIRNAVMFSPNGSQVASASEDKSVRIWDPKSSNELFVFGDHTEGINSISFSPDGSRLASGASDNTVRMWDAIKGVRLWTADGHTGAVNSVLFSPDGSILGSGADDNSVRIWDANSGAQVSILESHSEVVRSIAFSPDGSRLASASDDWTMKIWDIISSAPMSSQTERHVDRIKDVSFSPDGSRILSASKDHTLRMWDATSGELLQKLEGHTDFVQMCTFSPNGSQIASASGDATIRLWDASSAASTKVLEGHVKGVFAVAYSHDGTKLASGGEDATVRTWDVASGQQILSLQGHTEKVGVVAFSPDGSYIASGSVDTTVRTWNMPSGQSTTFASHTQDVYSLAFSPDSSKLASGSDDQTVRIWDIKSGAAIQLIGHSAWIQKLVFSSDGARLTSTGFMTEIMLWDAVSGALLWASTQAAVDSHSQASVAPESTEKPKEGATQEICYQNTSEDPATSEAPNHLPLLVGPNTPCEFLVGQIIAERPWIYRIDRKGSKRPLLYLPNEFDPSRLAFRTDIFPQRLAIGCLGGQFLLLDLSKLSE